MSDVRAITIPLKLLKEAHACMLATGWRDAPANATSADGILELAAAEVEHAVNALLRESEASHDL